MKLALIDTFPFSSIVAYAFNRTLPFSPLLLRYAWKQREFSSHFAEPYVLLLLLLFFVGCC
jgi:hypothetical protein